MNYVFETGLWETDFLLNEILPKANVEYINTSHLENTQYKCEVFAFSCRVHNFSSIKSTIQRLRPKIIIMLSDEFHQDNNSIYNELGNECELFLRQYHHSGYKYTSNTLHIPLGYTNGCKVFEENKNLKWSFFGSIKTDREEMISKFRKLNPYLIGNSLPKELMCKIYSKSIFVPCGRGNSSLDCFRLYETSMNGAVPVVVGSQEEIESTFKYEENPPWVFVESWSEAVEKCADIVVDSKDVVRWWNNRIKKIKTKILEVL